MIKDPPKDIPGTFYLPGLQSDHYLATHPRDIRDSLTLPLGLYTKIPNLLVLLLTNLSRRILLMLLFVAILFPYCQM